jgi:hypothetical protein
VNGPWQCLAAGLEDSVIANVRAYEEQKIAAPEVLYTDESAPAGTRFFYQLKAVNAAGETDYSNVVQCARP